MRSRISKAIQYNEKRNTESESKYDANKMERKTSNASDANISIELFKELFTNILREQEKKLLNFLRNSISETKLR